MNFEKEYNEWHKRVFESDPSHADEQSPWYRLVLEYLLAVDGKRILEIACGRGGFTALLASRGAVMFGADFSEEALQAARRKCRGDGCFHFDLTKADAECLPYADKSFDVVVSCETIEHVPHPATALSEMARVCRPGGTLYLTTPNYFNVMGLYYVYARLRGRQGTPGGDQPFDQVFLFPRIRNLLRQAGWRIMHSDGTVHQFPIRRGHNPILIEALESNRTIRRLLSPLAFHYFILAQRSDIL
jgi:2-polyprenyl-3-methyl-5-hydroxy-6-metoxy-1,4-benzoquinol methylase